MMEKLFETWSLDREIVLVKVLKHPRHKVFAAWMDPEALAQWYGPAGLSIENQKADIREGGEWRFDMVGVFEGQKQRFPNLMRFLKVVPNELIVVDYGTPDPNDPERFYMTITFDEQTDGKLDDPSFNAPIYANLFDDEGAETYTLIWSRSRKPNGD